MKSHRAMPWLSSALATAAIAMFACGTALAQKTELLVYTAIETDQLKQYADAFNKAVPDVEIKWVRDSTGVITSKLIAEKANPQADVIWGLAATSLLVLEGDGLLLPYAPAGIAAIGSAYKDTKNPPAWWGMDIWGATVCFNTIEAAKMNLPKPESWQDLTKPVYKGKIVMPNPASSGTGYLDVTSWLQMMGEQNGWKFMDGLHENIAQYTHSGSKPCVQAGAGEFPIGISFEYRANTIKAKGGPIDLIFPKEGLGWDMEAFAIMKNTKKLDAAKKLADWASSKAAMMEYAKGYAIVAVPGIAQPLPNVPADYEKRLAKNDFAWAAKNRDRILAEWTKRYDSKSEPKK
jgi:iron(III) transport system substrate-binding protein